MNETKLSHVDAGGRPQMVDVGVKQVGRREAVALSRVVFPGEVATKLRAEQMRVGKGPVIDTAIIAGTQAVKRTADLIPFCHPLPILGCRFEIDWIDDVTLQISCRVRTEHRTGVEMEALTGASIAALTIYDMCKALSHEIVISDTRLQAKRGGRHDFGEVAGDG